MLSSQIFCLSILVPQLSGVRTKITEKEFQLLPNLKLFIEELAGTNGTLNVDE